MDTSISLENQLRHLTIAGCSNLSNLIHETTTMRENLSQIRNTEQNSTHSNGLEVRSANRIKSFMKKVIAAQSYGKMFANGERFRELNQSFPQYKSQASLRALDHLNDVSRGYLQTIEEKLGKLSDEERELLRQVEHVKVTLRHQSNSQLVKNHKLNIFSQDKIARNNISMGTHTFYLDKIRLSNHDFVFFGMEFSEDKKQLPLNRIHFTVDYGGNAYLVESKYQYGYMTLTDHFDNRMPPRGYMEHIDFADQFPVATRETHRRVYNDKNKFDVPIFTVKDMRLALGLHLIDFIRNSKDDNLKGFALNGNLDSKNLDRLIHFVFQPEFHVPRLVSTTDYQYVKLRDIPLKDAIFASNIERINELVSTKRMACEAMHIAVKEHKKDVVYYLFDKFQFGQDDIPQMHSTYNDLLHILSDYCADTDILSLFLEKELIEVNKPFVTPNKGDTMLDNALKYKNDSMVELLVKHGALTSKELEQKSEVTNRKGQHSESSPWMGG